MLCRILTVIQYVFSTRPTSGQPLYLQLMQQIRHAAETGGLRDGEQLPGIRQGSGAFVCVKRRTKSLADHIKASRRRIRDLIEQLREDGLLDEEIRRAFEAELLYPAEIVRR